MIVGSPVVATGSPEGEAAYIYKRVNEVWHLEDELVPPDLSTNEQFGRSVAIFGSFAAVGNYEGKAVHVFERIGTDWVDAAQLDPPTDASAGFGIRVELDESNLLVSDWRHDGASQNAGAIYVYQRDGDAWVQTTMLFPPYMPVFGVVFMGRQLDYDGHRAIVNGSERAHIFERKRDVWTVQATLLPTVPPAHLQMEVGIDHDVAAIGSRSDDTFGEDAGAVYVFRRVGGAWLQEAVLHSPAPHVEARFGTQVDVRDDVIAVSEQLPGERDAFAIHVYRWTGSTWELEDSVTSHAVHVSATAASSVKLTQNGIISGRAFDERERGIDVFTQRKARWVQSQKLTHPNPMASDFFGDDVAISGDLVAILSFSASRPNTNTETVFIYDRTEGTFELDATIDLPDGPPLDIASCLALENDLLAVGITGTEPQVQLYRKTGEQWLLVGVVSPNDLSGDTLFGNAEIVLNDGRLFVGDPNDDEAGPNAGTVFVFENQNGMWTQQQKLLPQLPTGSPRMGHFIAVQGEWLAARAIPDVTHMFHFENGAWNFRHTVPKNGTLAMSSSVLVIGALQHATASVYQLDPATNTW